jgi:hypothetical protein
MGTQARRLGLEPPAPATVRATLAPVDGAILVYLPADAASHLFVVTTAGIEHHALASLAPTRARVRELRALLHQASAGPDPERSRRIADLAAGIRDEVLPPAVRAQSRRWRSLAVAGADLLANLPFEILPGERMAWLGAEQALWYLPSLPLGTTLARRRDVPADRTSLLVVAATRPGRAGLPHLPLDDGDVRQLAGTATPAEFLVGDGATPDAVRDAMRRGHAVFAFLGHGVSDAARAGDDRPGALVLAGRAPCELHCSDLDRLEGVPPVVVLAACGAGSGPARRGDDLGAHAAGALLHAGAAAVVAPAMDLELSTARAFVTSLHHALAAGAGVAEAARQARADVAAQAAFRDPAQLAVVQVLGLGDLAPFAGRRDGTVWRPPVGWLAAAAVAAAGLLLWRRRPRGDQPPPGVPPEPLGGGGSGSGM